MTKINTQRVPASPVSESRVSKTKNSAADCASSITKERGPMYTMKCPLLIEKEDAVIDRSLLLIPDDEVIPLSRGLVQLLGMIGAVCLQKLHWMLSDVATEKRPDHFKENRWWIRLSIPEWRQKLIMFKEWEMQRILTVLCKHQYIIASAEHDDSRDRGLWYTINYDRLNKVFEEEFDPVSRVYNRSFIYEGDSALLRKELEDVEFVASGNESKER
jgi:hypothetical protein